MKAADAWVGLLVSRQKLFAFVHDETKVYELHFEVMFFLDNNDLKLSSVFIPNRGFLPVLFCDVMWTIGREKPAGAKYVCQ